MSKKFRGSWLPFNSVATRFFPVMVVVMTVILAVPTVRAAKIGGGVPISPQTQECLDCHSTATPGIVKDWETSRHSRVTVGEALRKPPLEKRVSAENPPPTLKKYVVGCYECHSQHTGQHRDSFDHFGYRINVIVSPPDCATCHPVEANQYEGSKKADAYGNLMKNPVYHELVSTIDGLKSIDGDKIVSAAPSATTLNESCLGCHGTVVKVDGTETVHSELGDVVVPKLTNWPNQGVGRINPDGSKGSCTSCHPRHSFSIAVARKPYTCAQCHLEPDVPAWEVYRESKHGILLLSSGVKWDLEKVPWVVGRDFKAPTCATCHNALVTAPDGTVIAPRSHDFGARLWTRLFGLIYSHPQPKSGDTTIIRNADGLPLPTTFAGERASNYLIDPAEQARRQAGMEKICQSCHSTPWTTGHFAHLDEVIHETDAMTRSATQLVSLAWKRGLADKTNPFDEEIEKMWVEQWLFYANTMRYSSAMTGAPDYQAFKHGWWDMSKNLQGMKELIELKTAAGEGKEKK